MIDTERIFAYRALRIARGDQTPIEGYEQDDYIKNADCQMPALADLAEEFELVRKPMSDVYKIYRKLRGTGAARQQ
jgi:hypothetical protein